MLRVGRMVRETAENGGHSHLDDGYQGACKRWETPERGAGERTAHRATEVGGAVVRDVEDGPKGRPDEGDAADWNRVAHAILGGYPKNSSCSGWHTRGVALLGPFGSTGHARRHATKDVQPSQRANRPHRREPRAGKV